MNILEDMCCICIKNVDRLCTLDSSDPSDVKHITKLMFCAPKETWKSDYRICSLCETQLVVAYKFVQTCIDSEKFRNLDVKNDCDIDEKFACDHCGKAFRQKKYLSQHITKLHVNKKQGSNEKRVKQENYVSEVAEKVFNGSCMDIKSEIEQATVKEDNSIDDEHDKENASLIDQNIEDEKPATTIKYDKSDTDLGDITDFGNDDLKHDSIYTDPSDIEEYDDPAKKSPEKKKSPKKQPQKCDYCDEIFKKRRDWTIHIRTKHTFEKPFSCDQCDARYMNRYSLLIHSRKHKNEKPFICATCGKSFVSSADLNHHNKIHNIDRAYPCPMCDRSFKTHSNLRTHRLQMHLDPAEWKFPCNLCNKKFPIRGNLMKHLKRHAGIKEFDCPICDKKFVNKAELGLHLNTHTNQRLFKCHLCGKDYKNREGLRRHMKVVHDQGNWKAPKTEKKYLCPMCPKVFAFSNKLQRHIFSHTGEKPFKCDYCQKRFIDNYGRKVHYKKDHNIDYFVGS